MKSSVVSKEYQTKQSTKEGDVPILAIVTINLDITLFLQWIEEITGLVWKYKANLSKTFMP